MKWFKHDTSARNDTKIKLLKKKFGAGGYGVYFQILEIVGENVKEKNQQDWGFVEEAHTIETLADESGVSPDTLRTMLGYMNEIGLLFKIQGRLCVPNILSRIDEYAQKRRGDLDCYERQEELSRLSRDNVGTLSRQSRALEENRIEEKRREERAPSTEKSSKKTTENKKGIDSLKDPEFIRELEVMFPGADVRFEIEKMKDWVLSKGKAPKDYRAQMRNWIRRDHQPVGNVIVASAPPKSKNMVFDEKRQVFVEKEDK